MKRERFLCDSMLGSLSKWMRFLGYDTAFYKFNNTDQNYLISLRENRLFLTKNTKYKDKKNTLLIKLDLVEQQFYELKEILPEPSSFMRCSECNIVLEGIKKQNLKYKIPPYIYRSKQKFLVCKRCGRIYWQGTHLSNIKKKIKLLSDILK